VSERPVPPGIPHTQLGAGHAELGASHTEVGGSHTELGASHTELGASGSELGVNHTALDTIPTEPLTSHTGHGSATSGRGAIRTELGLIQTDLGVSRAKLGVSRAKLGVSRASEADVQDIVPLFLDYLRFYGVPAVEGRAREFINARLARGESAIFVAYDAGLPAGFTQLYPGFSSLDLAPQWTLEDLFVTPSARNRGIARALLAAAENLARGTGAVRLTLSTAVTNANAQRLYESAGWMRDDAFYVYALTLKNS
jgi:GNAT superfamily N-acetyltransferase